MQPYQANAAAPTSTALRLAHLSLLDETIGTLARLVAYVGVLALLAIIGVYGLQQLLNLQDAQLTPLAGWLDSGAKISAYARIGPPAPGPEADWLTGAEKAQLRGAL